MTVYPALVEEGGTVKEGRFSTPAEAEFQHRRALQRLLMQQLTEPAKFLRSKLPGITELGLLYRELGRVDALVEDILLASLDSCILEGEDPLPRDGAGLAALAERKRGSWTEHAERVARLTLEILKLWHGLQKRFKGKIDLAQAVALNDIKQQISHLVYPGFVRETPMQWLKELPRYLKAVEQRFENSVRKYRRIASGAVNWPASGRNTRSARRNMPRKANAIRSWSCTAGGWRNTGCRCSPSSWERKCRSRTSG